MAINLKAPEQKELRPRITVLGVGGAGGNAVNNMIGAKLEGVEFVVANTDAQALAQSKAERKIQIGALTTEGLGAGAQPDVGRAGAEESLDEILEQLGGSHMVFITAGMGGGTGTGAAPVIARAVRELGILTVKERTQPTLPGVEETATENRQGGDIQADPKSIPSASELAASMELDQPAQPSLLERAGVTDTKPAKQQPAIKPKAQHSDAPYCMQCGVQMVRAGSCHACPSCGTTSGCS